MVAPLLKGIKMSRCKRIWGLEVHHKKVNGGNKLDNAQVLCQKCHENTSSYGDSDHKSPEPFTDKVKEEALKRAGNRCECEKDPCCLK